MSPVVMLVMVMLPVTHSWRVARGNYLAELIGAEVVACACKLELATLLARPNIAPTGHVGGCCNSASCLAGCRLAVLRETWAQSSSLKSHRRPFEPLVVRLQLHVLQDGRLVCHPTPHLFGVRPTYAEGARPYGPGVHIPETSLMTSHCERWYTLGSSTVPSAPAGTAPFAASGP
jgi:hypothetical protein